MNLLSKGGATTNIYRQIKAERVSMPLLGGLAGTLALSVYLATLAPDLTWQHSSYDGGELITAAVTLGIPHPPGYPTYVLLGKIVSLIPIATVAFRFNLFSAICVAIAAALLTITIGHLYFSQNNGLNINGGIAALAAGLAFAYTPLVWSQAIVTEVYGLNLALLAGFLWALTVRRSYRLAALLLGLSITAHLTSLFVLPLALGLTPRAQWRTSAVWLLIGLTPLATLPLLAQTNSPVMWGQPTDLQGWWWLASGRLYHNNLRFPPDGQHIAQVLKALLQQFAWLGLPLALSTLYILQPLKRRTLKRPARTQNLLKTGLKPLPQTDSEYVSTHFSPPSCGFQSTVMAVTIALYTGYALLYHTADAPVFLLPALLLLAILIAPALRLAGIAALTLPIALLLLNFQMLNASQDHQVRPLAESVLTAAPNNAILLTPGDRSIFSLWYFHHVEDQRPDVILVDSNLFAFPWYRQRLQEQYPNLRGLEVDNLMTFRQINQQQRPICQANLVELNGEPPGIQCNEK